MEFKNVQQQNGLGKGDLTRVWSSPRFPTESLSPLPQEIESELLQCERQDESIDRQLGYDRMKGVKLKLMKPEIGKRVLKIETPLQIDLDNSSDS